MGWGQLAGMGLQAYGSYVGGEASKRDVRAQQQLASQYQDAYGAFAQRQNAGQQGLVDRMQNLALQNYGSYNTLGADLGARDQAGITAGNASDARMTAALAGMPAAPSRANVGGGNAAWGEAADAQRYAPVMQARSDLMRQNAVNSGMAMSDRNAMGNAASRQVVIGRQTAEAQQQEAVLAAYRQMLLERAGIENQYKGPGAGYYNSQLYSQGLNLAGTAAMSYGQYAGNQQPGYSNSFDASNRPQGPAR